MENGNNTLWGRTILLVNTGSLKKKFILQKLKKMGLTLVVLNKEKNWAQPYVDHWILSDISDHSESISNLKSFINNNPNVKINGVLTFWEDDVLLTSKIVDRFKFVGIPFNVAKKARNKYLFREFCQENGISAPRYKLIRSMEDINYVCENFNFPLVIKPTYGSGSVYVVKVENKSELIETFNYIKNNISINTESALADGLDILVEEWAIRRAKEEMGVDCEIIKPLKPMILWQEDKTIILIHYLAKRTSDKIEPADFIDVWDWFDIKNLPADCAPNIKPVIEEYLREK